MRPSNRILLVDDDPDVRACVRMILEDEGYLVDEAGNGPAALDRLRRDGVDLLLLDERMPGMDGAEVLARARGEDLVHFPVLLVTAGEEPSDGSRRSDVDGILFKPFELDDLLELVSARLHRPA